MHSEFYRRPPFGSPSRPQLKTFTSRQRAHWIRIARDSSVPVWVLVFDTPVQVCNLCLGSRCSDMLRRFVRKGSVLVSTKAATTPRFIDHSPQPTTGVGHPTIKDFEQASQVLSRFHSQFRYPRPDEGYDKILYLKPSDHPSPHWSPGEIAAILSRLEGSTPRGRGISDGGTLTVGSS